MTLRSGKHEQTVHSWLPVRDRCIDAPVQGRVVEKNPRSMELNLYANLLFENGDTQKAIEMGEKACEISQYYRFKNDVGRFKAALR